MLLGGIRLCDIPILCYKALCKLLCPLAYFMASYMPLKNRIVFRSTPDYADNARVMCDYMLDDSRFEDFEFCWIVESKTAARTIKKRGMSPVRIRHKVIGPIAALISARSRCVMYTHGLFPSYYSIPKGQIVVNLWHGCGYKAATPKKMEFTFALVPGELFIDIKARAFCCEREKILPIGYPRYDSILRPSISFDEMKLNLGMPARLRLVLWLPTFRKHAFANYAEGSMETGCGLPLLGGCADMDDLDKFCAEEGLYLLIKRHPSQVPYDFEKKGAKWKNIRLVTQKDLDEMRISLYELFAYSGALISDYSSAAIDYLILNKPLGYLLDDYEEYYLKRGFCLDNPKLYMPGAHITSYEELKSFLFDVAHGVDSDRDARNKIASVAHNPCTSYRERLVEQLVQSGLMACLGGDD